MDLKSKRVPPPQASTLYAEPHGYLEYSTIYLWIIQDFLRNPSLPAAVKHYTCHQGSRVESGFSNFAYAQ